MRFFVDEIKRKASHSSCYFEFQKGRYHNKCWLPDSISIRDIMWDQYGLTELFSSVVKNFDYYGLTTITKGQWDRIVKKSQDSGTILVDIIAEAIPWVNECFESYRIFTIVGM